MKTLLTLIAVTFCSFAFSQDYIVRRNGTKIEAQVIEISDTEIRYRLHSQPNGPIRIVMVRDVEEIIYEDGQFDKFEKQPDAQAPKTVYTRTETEKVKKDPILQGGFFLEGLIGYANYRVGSYYYYDNFTGTSYIADQSRSELALTIRFGSKWYFGQREKWRPGLQATWLRLGNYIDTRDAETLIIGTKSLSIANVGMTNAFRFNDKIGLEANFSVGPTLLIDPDYGSAHMGLLIGPEVKLRIGSLAIGLDYANMFGYASEVPNDFNVISLSVGAKF